MTLKPPIKQSNALKRSREYLTPSEVDQLIKAAKKLGRHGHRDGLMIMLSFRHGLRASELVALRWEQFDIKASLFHIRRKKNGSPSTHFLYGPEIRSLRKLKRDYPDTPYVFISERKGPMTTSNVRKLVARAGEEAVFPFLVHPHMLRHACGFKLANDGHDTRAIQHYLGHKNIQHTVRYTNLAADRFKDFWDD